MCSPAYGQDIDDTIKLALNSGVTTTPTSARSNSDHSQSKIDNLSLYNTIDIDIFNNARSYSIDLPDYWNNYANQPRHIYRLKYKGLYGLMHKQVSRLFYKYYKDNSQEYWKEQSYTNDPTFTSRYRQFKIMESDFHTRWWNRDFFQYLGVEKGGSEIRSYTIGETYDVLSLGPLNITNAGRVSWSGWDLNFSHGRDKQLDRRRDEFGNLINNETDNTLARSIIKIKEIDRAFVFGISPPKGNIFTGNNWTLSGNVRADIRVDTFDSNGTTFSGSVNFISYYGMRHTPWISVKLEGKAKPFQEDYQLELTIVMLSF